MSDQQAEFDSAWQLASGVDGWLSEDQARRLHARARVIGPKPATGETGTADLCETATVVEIGSFRGRSTIVLGSAAPEGAAVIAIDPHGGGDRGPGEIAPDTARGDADHEAFNRNLEKADVAKRVRHVRKPSSEALGDVFGDLDLLFVDGAHRFAPARADLVQWGSRVSLGATMLVHDAFSSVGVTLALMTTTFWSRRWRYMGRVGSLAEYRCDVLPVRDRMANAARQTAQLGWFVRNLVIKVLITVRLGRLTRLLGHRGGWPY